MLKRSKGDGMTSSKKKNKNIKLNISPDESLDESQTSVLDESYLEPDNAKWKITMNLDADVYKAIRELADRQNKKYQRLINEILRDVVVKKTKRTDPDVKELKRRIDILEKAFLKKSAS